ncbi:MAG: flagellar hook-associated protein FlgL [Gammaproteobacteria bacterium]
MRIPTFGMYQRESGQISQMYDSLGKLIQQADSGKKLIHSSDDPVLAHQIKSKEDYVNTLQSYFDNGVLAGSHATLFTTSAQSAVNVTSQIQTLLKSAQSGTKNDSDRASIAEQLKGYLSNMASIANTQDGSGEFIYAGNNSDAPAYILVNGVYQYQGGSSQTQVNIAPEISTLYTDVGSEVFGNIYDGNGTFTVTAGSGNTGGASTTPGAVINSASYVADTYTITFGTNGGSLVYQVVGATSGQVIPALPATFPAGAPTYTGSSDVNFNGISLHINGTPSVGDTFQIQPSTRQDVFGSLQNLITLLQTPNTNPAKLDQALIQADASFGQISNHLVTYMSQAGTASSAVKAQVDANRDIIHNQTITINDLANADIGQVYSALSQQSLALQATIGGYMKMQDTLNKLLQMQF